MGRQLTINVDVDGVVYDFVGSFLRIARAYGEVGAELTTDDITSWAVWDHVGISKSRFWDRFHEYIAYDNLFSTGDAIFGAVPVLKDLSSEHRVRFVTSKTLSYKDTTLMARQQTLDFLARTCGFHRNEVVFTGGHAKQGYPADVVIDDKPNLEWVQEGALNILFAQPWNKSVEFAPGIVREGNWFAIGDRVTHIAQEVTA